MLFLSWMHTFAFEYDERVAFYGDAMVEILQKNPAIRDEVMQKIYQKRKEVSGMRILKDEFAEAKRKRQELLIDELIMYLHEKGIVESALRWHENQKF